ncbi:MAG: T9SS type A sorting domain-containing protein [Bacteroidota bacterium]
MKKVIFTLSLILGYFFANANNTFNSYGFDFNCSVTIDTVQNGACFQAVPSGTAPFTFFWTDSTTVSTTCNNGIFSQLCVTVTDADGCVATACVTLNPPPSCTAYIYEDTILGAPTYNLTAGSNGIAPFTYLWSTGETTQHIVPSSTGNYCVTVTDANGCSDSPCFYADLSTNPNGCTANITDDSTFTDLCLTVTATGVAPFTYSWLNGASTSATFCVGNSGIVIPDTVCVTVTDANGCVAIDCYDLSNLCSVSIALSGNEITAVPAGDPNNQYTYSWSTGENTPTIQLTTSGNYCVTVTNSLGCDATSCYSYTLNDYIEGVITLDSTALGGGSNGTNTFLVYLIQNDPNAGTLTAVDSVLVTSTPNNWGAFYSFTGLAGDYLVKAAIQPGSDQYDNYLPTYFGDVLYWDEATTVTVPSTPNNWKIINMINGTNPGGPGFIGGLIVDGANFAPNQVETRGDGDPLENISILLLTENDEPVTHTVTDANGEFEFPSVAYGTYKLVVEVLGKAQGIKFVTLAPDNATVDDVYFEVNSEFVTKIEDVLNGASLKVFPNPAETTLNVQVDIRTSTQLNISVSSLLGKRIISETLQLDEGTQTMTIPVHQLPSGIYFLNLSDGNSIISRKITKK